MWVRSLPARRIEPPADPSVAGQVVHDRHGHRRLPAAGLAHQAEGLTPLDREIDVADGRLPVGADLVIDIEVLDFEHRLLTSLARSPVYSMAWLMASATRLTPTTSEAIASAGNSTGHHTFPVRKP